MPITIIYIIKTTTFFHNHKKILCLHRTHKCSVNHKEGDHISEKMRCNNYVRACDVGIYVLNILFIVLYTYVGSASR